MTQLRIIPRADRDRLGEGPLWSQRAGALFWVDILGQKLHRLAGEALTSWDLPEMTGWVIEREAGGFIAGMRSGFHSLDLDPFAIAAFAIPGDHPETNRFNDAKADARGRIFAGTMATAKDAPSGCLYRLDPGGGVTRVDHGYTIANGPAISPDGRTLLHTDSAARRIWRFAIGDDGDLGDRTLFRELTGDEGYPDGMTFDANGDLWLAQWGAGCVGRYTMDGVCRQRIALPASQISSCTFGGEGLDRLFVTSASDGVDEPHAGALFEVDPGVHGLPALRFAG
ncbi:gluconolaconase [alpha proteobacterium AAP81b]|nr:gluconolaconase [alpha proteobacterium AAP81b]